MKFIDCVAISFLNEKKRRKENLTENLPLEIVFFPFICTFLFSVETKKSKMFIANANFRSISFKILFVAFVSIDRF